MAGAGRWQRPTALPQLPAILLLLALVLFPSVVLGVRFQRGARTASDASRSQLRLEPCYPPPCPGYSVGHVLPSADNPGLAVSFDDLPALSQQQQQDGDGADDFSAAPPSPKSLPGDLEEQSSGNSQPPDTSLAEDDSSVDPEDYLVRILHAPPVLSEPALPPEALRAVNEIQRLDKLITGHRRDIERRQLWLSHAREALSTLQTHMESARRTVTQLQSSVGFARSQQQSIRERLARDELLDQLDATQTRLDALVEQEVPLQAKTEELRAREARLKAIIQELQTGHQLLTSRLAPS